MYCKLVAVMLYSFHLHKKMYYYLCAHFNPYNLFVILTQTKKKSTRFSGFKKKKLKTSNNTLDRLTSWSVYSIVVSLFITNFFCLIIFLKYPCSFCSFMFFVFEPTKASVISQLNSMCTLFNVHMNVVLHTSILQYVHQHVTYTHAVTSTAVCAQWLIFFGISLILECLSYIFYLYIWMQICWKANENKLSVKGRKKA